MADWSCKLTAVLTLGGDLESCLKEWLAFQKRQKESSPQLQRILAPSQGQAAEISFISPNIHYLWDNLKKKSSDHIKVKAFALRYFPSKLKIQVSCI